MQPNENFTLATPASAFFFPPFFTTRNLTFFGETAVVVLMAGACGAAFLAAAVALAGDSSVIGRLLDFWLCGDAGEATRLVRQGTALAEAALAAGSRAEDAYFGGEDDLDGGAVVAEVADCFVTVFSLSLSAANLSAERFVMFSGSTCNAQNETH